MIRDLPALVAYYGSEPQMTGDSSFYGDEHALASKDGDTTRWSVGEVLGNNAGSITATFPGVPDEVTAAWFVIRARTDGDYAEGVRVNSPPVATFDRISVADYTEFVTPTSIQAALDAYLGYSFTLNRPSATETGPAGTAIFHVTYWALRVESEYDGPAQQRAYMAPNRVLQRGNDGLGLSGGKRVFGGRSMQATNRRGGTFR
jgi:hypothetical protein